MPATQSNILLHARVNNHSHTRSQGPLIGVVKMAAFRRAYDIVQHTIEILNNSEMTSFEIDGISMRIDYLTRTLVNLDSNCTPTHEIVQLLGETSRHLRDVASQSTVCAIQYAPKIYSGECGRPSFEIKEEQATV